MIMILRLGFTLSAKPESTVIVPGTWNLTEESEHPEALVNRICSFLERAFSCCSLTGVLGATMKLPYNGTSLNVDIGVRII
ncbi:hypothetical protein SDJN03_08325, partial [Cucurbita argyrosperma subsp. sororia]